MPASPVGRARAGLTRLGRGLLSLVLLRSPGTSPRPRTPAAEAYAGDFQGIARIEYRPYPDGRADPGEVVWAWVPFEEDPGRGKDRPVLVVARDGGRLLGLMMSSRERSAAERRDQAARGRVWVPVGSGAWDAAGRPSAVRLDRVLRLEPDRVRREGAALDRGRFDEVADRLRRLHRWP